MRTKVIVNPTSSNGHTGREWHRVEAQMRQVVGDVAVEFTSAPGVATPMARAALEAGFERIVAVGGDGTVNEVVNGFFAPDGTPRNPEAEFAMLMTGTGGDFRKTFGLPRDLGGQVAALKTGIVRRIDIGRLEFTGHDGSRQTRFFDNIASFGISGRVDREVNAADVIKRLGGKAAFGWGTLMALIAYRNQDVTLSFDDGPAEARRINVVAVCNGRFFGGGMMIGPDALPDDGLFDVVTIGDITLWEAIKNSPSVYKGEHIRRSKIEVRRARRLAALPVAGAEVLLDVDGEAPGRLPASFTLMPAALKLRLPPTQS